MQRKIKSNRFFYFLVKKKFEKNETACAVTEYKA